VKCRNFFYSFIFLFVSCSPLTRIGIEVLVPSEVTINSDIDKVVILNNATYPDADSIYQDFTEPLSENELFIIDTIVTANTFNGLFAVLNESPVPVLRDADYVEVRNTGETLLPEPLSEIAVINFCNETGSDLLISYEYYNFTIRYYNDYGYLPEVHSYLEFNRKFAWRIYGKDGRLIDDYLLNDTVFWSSAGNSRYEAENGLPGVTDAIRNAFYYGGEMYGKRISPSWQQASRVYYKLTERRILRRGTDNSFEETYLIELTNSTRKSGAYKACINLALMNEKKDNLKEAIYWLDLADTKKPSTRLVRMYRDIIRERLINREKINKQLRITY